MTNADRRIAEHEILGQRRIYRADLPPYDAATDNEPGRLVVGNGMTMTVEAAWHDWNDVPGLDMLYAVCEQTGERTHVTPAELGWTTPLGRS